MFKHNRLFIVFFALLLLVASTVPAALGAKDASEQRERAMKAAEVLNEVMGVPEKGIPDELMEHAHAIAVIPHVVKGAIGLGGQHGKGLVSHRHTDGKWGAPAFIDLSGGSFGLQLGIQATDVVLIFTSEDGFKGLLDGKLKLGADASVAAGPVGRKAEVGTDVLLKSPVFAYSRSKGVFAGISLDGSVVSIDDSGNREVYEKDVPAKDILLNNAVRINDIVAPFVRALEKYSPAGKHVSDN